MGLSRIRKLCKMSLAEILVRTREVGYRCAERWTYGKPRPAVKPTLIGHPGERATRLVLGASAEERERLPARFPELAEKWGSRARKQAQELLEGKVHLLGRDCAVTLDTNWQQDPLSNHVFEDKFYHDLSLYELSADLDVKYVWELNRHQFFFALARDWYYNRNHESPKRLRELMLSWIDQNPLYVGVNWTSALEAAMRVNSWMWSLAATNDWPGGTDSDLQRIEGALHNHGRYLFRHFSYYSSPYNHLMGEAGTLLVLSHWLDDNAQTRKWESRSRRTLEQRGLDQFYDDGFCVEQATGYHFYTLGFMCLALLSAERAEKPLSAPLREKLAQAFQASLTFRQPDDCWPWIGDVDTARSIPVLDDNFWDFGGLISLGGVLFDDPILLSEGRAGEETFWLTGTEGLNRHAHAEGAAARHFYLGSSGYVRTQLGQGRKAKWLLFDAGPIAAGLHSNGTPSVAHGHADQLGIWYYAGGPVLGDSGMPRYGGDRVWVDYFREAAAHSTITVDSHTSPQTAGRLGWAHAIEPESLDACMDDEMAIGSGTLELGPGCRIERHFLLSQSAGLWVADVVQSERGEVVRLYWQLQQDEQAQRTDNSILFQNQRIRCFSLEPGAWTINRPEESAPAGWLAQGYGKLSPGCRVCYTTRMSSSHTIVLTHIGKEMADATFQSVQTEGVLSLSSDHTSTNCQEATWIVRTAQDEFMLSFAEPKDDRWRRNPGVLATRAAYCLHREHQSTKQRGQSVK